MHIFNICSLKSIQIQFRFTPFLFYLFWTFGPPTWRIIYRLLTLYKREQHDLWVDTKEAAERASDEKPDKTTFLYTILEVWLKIQFSRVLLSRVSLSISMWIHDIFRPYEQRCSCSPNYQCSQNFKRKRCFLVNNNLLLQFFSFSYHFRLLRAQLSVTQVRSLPGYCT